MGRSWYSGPGRRDLGVSLGLRTAELPGACWVVLMKWSNRSHNSTGGQGLVGQKWKRNASGILREIYQWKIRSVSGSVEHKVSLAGRWCWGILSPYCC